MRFKTIDTKEYPLVSTIGTIRIDISELNIDSVLNVYIDSLMYGFHFNTVSKSLIISGYNFTNVAQMVTLQYISKIEDTIENRDNKLKTILTKT